MITRKTSLQNLFLSHAWDIDLRGRSTHDRVKMLKEELTKHGWKLWFDEERLLLGCNIDAQMSEGITQSDAVCICITRQYIEKVNSQARDDNCAKEWNFAQATGKKMLPLIFEKEMLDIKAWPSGVMTMYLSNTFYIDCTADNLKDVSKRISSMLTLLGLQPRLAHRYSWPISKPLRKQLSRNISNSKLSHIIRI